jgi:hypothetical protein
MARQPPVGQGLLIIEASRSHSGTPHMVGLLWTSDQPDTETFTRQHTTLTTDIHTLASFEPAVLGSERPETHTLDRTATGIGRLCEQLCKMNLFLYIDTNSLFLYIFIRLVMDLAAAIAQSV